MTASVAHAEAAIHRQHRAGDVGRIRSGQEGNGTGNFSRGRYYDENLRTIAPEGVAHVMRVFDQTYGLTEPVADADAPPRTARPSRLFSDDDANVLCDEAEIVKTLGF